MTVIFKSWTDCLEAFEAYGVPEDGRSKMYQYALDPILLSERMFYPTGSFKLVRWPVGWFSGGRERWSHSPFTECCTWIGYTPLKEP